MPVFQRRLLICAMLSTLSATSWADSVIVNTLADENNNNNAFCSLREAVDYLKDKTDKLDAVNNSISSHNIKISEQRRLQQQKEDELKDEKSKPEASQNKTLISELETAISESKQRITDEQAAIKKLEDEMQAFRDAGKNGCVSKDSTSADVITLQDTGSVYQIESEIVIKSSLSISDAGRQGTDGTEDPVPLTSTSVKRTLIKAAGKHRLFRIDNGLASDHDNDPKTAERRILVTFTSLDLQGCNQDACADNGGIFYNADELSLIQCILSDGNASGLGGAVYNASRTFFAANEVAFQNNKASNGAAIFSEEVNLTINKSLFTNNTGASIITTANKAVGTARQHLIASSTIGKNTGRAINAREGLILNNLTIVQNASGINFQGDVPSVFNSIVAGNGQDCLNVGTGTAADTAYFSNNVFMTGCPELANANNKKISGTGTETLIADSNNDGVCDMPPAVGLLCPLGNYDGLTNTYKPRLLTSYRTLADALIVNKGFINSANSIGVLCLNNDQRGKTRSDTANDNRCDIGAVELQDTTTTASRQGQDIKFGQTATFDLLERLGDAEIWPAALCPDIHGAKAEAYLDGCVRSDTWFKHGTISFDNAKHTVTYRPNSAEFHGYEDFSYYLTTTISRFSDAINNNTMKVNVRVVSEPTGSATSKSLDTGATSLLSLLVMGLLMVWRRIR